MNTRVAKFVFSPFMENTFVVYDDSGECVIVDPGCYDESEEGELKNFIEQNELKPVLLLNTHSHLDHIFGNHFVASTWGLTPRVHPLDQPIYEAFEQSCQRFMIKPKNLPPEPVYDLVEGEDIEFGNTRFKVHFLPGHCPGHVAFECVEANFILSGDVLFSQGIGRTDLPGGDLKTLLSSINDKMMKLDPARVVLSGHGPETTLGREKESNPYLNSSIPGH